MYILLSAFAFGYYLVDTGVEVDVNCTEYYTYIWRKGCAGSSALAYLYVFLDFLFTSWLIANMAEMPGVRQIDGSCPFFCRI